LGWLNPHLVSVVPQHRQRDPFSFHDISGIIKASEADRSFDSDVVVLGGSTSNQLLNKSSEWEFYYILIIRNPP